MKLRECTLVSEQQRGGRRCVGCEIATLGLASWSTMTSPKVISANLEFLILKWRRWRPRRYLRGVDGVCGRNGGILIVIDTGVLISGRSRDKQRSNNFVPNTDGRVLTTTTQNLFNRLMFNWHKVQPLIWTL